VLRDHGNISAATVLFVLSRALATGLPGRSLVAGMGPGFCAGFILVEGP
jgi:alkylresorcinol/alkylpyrone synthase